MEKKKSIVRGQRNCHKITSKSCSSSPDRACAYFVTQTNFERKDRNLHYCSRERAIDSKKKLVDLSSNTRKQKKFLSERFCAKV